MYNEWRYIEITFKNQYYTTGSPSIVKYKNTLI